MEWLRSSLHFIFYLVIILAVIYGVYVLYLYQEPDGQKYDFGVGKNIPNQNMKLILLRHGERSNAPSFYTELNQNGQQQAKDLVGKLSQYNIDEIISSPFIRTLQTVYPYAEKYSKEIKIDYGIYEYRNDNVFKKDANVYTTHDIQQPSLTHKIDNSYTSSIQPDKLESTRNEYGKVELETMEQLEKRVYQFMNTILSNPSFNGKTVLIVSHKSVINMMRKYLKDTEKNNGQIDMRVFPQANILFDETPYAFAHYVVYEQKSLEK